MEAENSEDEPHDIPRWRPPLNTETQRHPPTTQATVLGRVIKQEPPLQQQQQEEEKQLDQTKMVAEKEKAEPQKSAPAVVVKEEAAEEEPMEAEETTTATEMMEMEQQQQGEKSPPPAPQTNKGPKVEISGAEGEEEEDEGWRGLYGPFLPTAYPPPNDEEQLQIPHKKSTTVNRLQHHQKNQIYQRSPAGGGAPRSGTGGAAGTTILGEQQAEGVQEQQKSSQQLVGGGAESAGGVGTGTLATPPTTTTLTPEVPASSLGTPAAVPVGGPPSNQPALLINSPYSSSLGGGPGSTLTLPPSVQPPPSVGATLGPLSVPPPQSVPAPQTPLNQLGIGGGPGQRAQGGGGVGATGAGGGQLEASANAASSHYRGPPVTVIDADTLARVLQPEPDGSGLSPLEHFLFGQTFLARLHACVEAWRREQRDRKIITLPIQDITAEPGSLLITLPGYPLPEPVHPTPGGYGGLHQPPQTKEPCSIRIHFFICLKRFRLLVRLNYYGPCCPREQDVRVFERFFERFITVAHFNELSVYTFITLARVTSPPIFASFAQLMLAQIEGFPGFGWRADLRLVIQDTHEMGDLQRRPGVTVPQSHNSILFALSLHQKAQPPPAQNPNQPKTAEQQQQFDLLAPAQVLLFKYDVIQNELSLFTAPSSGRDHFIQDVFGKAQRELITRAVGSGEQAPCSIWPCVRAMLAECAPF